VDEPRTHYQLSFTVRQAMALFVGLLVALSVAYFLGVMTGLAGRESEGAKASAPSAAARETLPGGSSETTSGEPLRAAGAVESAPSGTATETGAAGKLQLFEDRAEEDVTHGPVVRTVTPARVSATPFWVQVVSVRSQHEARAERQKLSSHGYHATVETVPGPKGNLYRVRVGPYHTREEAARAAEHLSRQEKVKAWIAPAGK
jgi:cell division septation protein DedD